MFTAHFTSRIIGFGGPIGSGKSTAAAIAEKLLSNAGVPNIIIPCAKELKDIALDRFGWDGKKDAKGRVLLQNLGAAGRAYDEDIWVKALVRRITGLPGDWVVLIDDCRFANEVELINAHGVSILMANRAAPQEGIINHESETNFIKCDWRTVISNSGDIDELYFAVRAALIAYKFIPNTNTLEEVL